MVFISTVWLIFNNYSITHFNISEKEYEHLFTANVQLFTSENLTVNPKLQGFLESKVYLSHYENLPMQYTVIFKVVKNENFQ